MPIATQKTPENESKGWLVNCSRGREGRSQLGVLGNSPSLLELSEWLWPCDSLKQAWIFTSSKKRKGKRVYALWFLLGVVGYFKRNHDQKRTALEIRSF